MSDFETTAFEWSWQGQAVELRLDAAGQGPTVLFLPALSSISTRSEMHPIMEHLRTNFHVAAVDWPGFGDRPRPKVDWTPDALSAFLDWLLSEIVPDATAIVAAGHAAAYALQQIRDGRGTIERLVLIAPTWRGPFPTMMGGQRPWFRHVRSVVDAPIIGPLLYAANLSRPVITKMVSEHVYSDPAWLTPERIEERLAVTTPAGARFASVRFVTGGLDRVDSREALLALARAADMPILVLYGEDTPPKSRAEMEALARLDGIETVRLPKGKLAVHEEFAENVAARILAFLKAEAT